MENNNNQHCHCDDNHDYNEIEMRMRGISTENSFFFSFCLFLVFLIKWCQNCLAFNILWMPNRHHCVHAFLKPYFKFPLMSFNCRRLSCSLDIFWASGWRWFFFVPIYFVWFLQIFDRSRMRLNRGWQLWLLWFIRFYKFLIIMEGLGFVRMLRNVRFEAGVETWKQRTFFMEKFYDRLKKCSVWKKKTSFHTLGFFFWKFGTFWKFLENLSYQNSIQFAQSIRS